MGSKAKKFATYQDLLAVPDHLIAEIIAGELITSPRPANRHILTASSLGEELVGPFQKGKRGGPGGWWILDEPELHLSGDVLVPDLAGWKKESLSHEALGKAAFEIPPQWICEILSPSTARIDRVQKLPIYAREKVEHVWLLHPIDKTLDIYKRSDLGGWNLLKSYVGNDRVRAEPFDAIELDLGSLWLPEED